MEGTMLRRLLSAVAALAFLLGGATVAMEALGLIFRVGPAEPGQRVEAAIARIEANANPMHVPREAEVEWLWPPPEEPLAEPKAGPKKTPDTPLRTAALVPPPDEGLPGGDKPPGIAAVRAAWAPRVVVETRVQTKALPASVSLPASAEAHGPPIGIAARIETAPPAAAAAKTERCTGECGAVRPSPHKGRPARAEARRTPRAANPIDCPLLGWLAIGPAS
jgi:hypothetical protein